MYQYSNSLIRQFPSQVTGNAAVGIHATVYVGETNTLAQLFEVSGAAKSNPVTTDDKGFYSFSLADGDYRIVFSSSQFATLRISVLDGAQIREDFDDLVASNTAFRNEQQAAYDSFVLSQGWDQVGTFAAGFTYTSPNQVGQDSSGNWWRWNGAFNKVVTAGTLPSSDANYKLVGDGVLRNDLNAGTVPIKHLDGTAALPSIAFGSDPDTGMFRKAENSVALSTGGVERLNITATGRVGVGAGSDTVAAQLHVQQSQLAIGILSRGYYEGSTAAPYVNNDIILCETYNKTLSDSANRSWAISCSNAYHDVPVGVTDSGTRVGCLGWAVSVSGRPGYEHRGTIGELTGVMGTSGFQGAGYSGAVITEAAAVRGVVYADNAGGIIRFARAGIFASDGVVGGSTIEENAAIYARAQRGTVSNYSFYGELGELYNQNVIHSPEKISGGSKYTQSNAPITARVGRNGFEFGFPDGSGYGSNIGATQSLGYPFFAFCAEADATGDAYTTRGKLGTVVYNNLSGSTIYGRLTNANAAGQLVVEDMRHRSDGKFAFNKNIMIPSTPPATATSAGEAGEVTWDANYFYVCVAANTWKRTALAAW